MRCGIMRTNEAALQAVSTPIEPRLHNLFRRFFVMSESYHASTRSRKTCKHTIAPTGIYTILHVASGKVYIGSALCVRCRWNGHRSTLNLGKHRNGYLQAVWNKYGKDAFVFSILEECSPDKLDEREQYWLDISQCTDERFGFNLAPIAQSQRGIKRSEEFCKKLRNRTTSEDTRKLLSQANLGKKRPPEDCKKISEHSAKRRLTQEQVVEIQERYEASNHLIKQIDLAKEYGVAGHTISCVVRRAHPRYQTDVPYSGESTRKLSGTASMDVEKHKAIASKGGKSHQGENHPMAKLTLEKVQAIRLKIEQGTSALVLAQEYNVTSNTIWDIVSFKTWKEKDKE
jgi:group I intron endonuclease